MRTLWGQLKRDLEAPVAARGFGTGWFAGFFAIVLALLGLGLVAALRWPNWLAMPELDLIRATPAFRPLVHLTLIGAYALALLSLLLRPRKTLGTTALLVALGATLLGGAGVQPQETRDWGLFFGLDFFVLNMVAAGLMFAPLERLFPRIETQRLFRQEWHEDLFYFLVSSMLVQLITFLALAPSGYVNARVAWLDGARLAVAALPWLAQFALAMALTDLTQYGIHRLFHRIPLLWRFHAVHHSARTMDWLAGSRLHIAEIVVVRGVTALPLLTLGFLPSVMQAYVGVVYVYASLIHGNLRGDFNRLGKWVVVPRYHHWHHAIEPEAADRNFAIHFPIIDRLFGTYHLPDSRWPTGYGVHEPVPRGYLPQLGYPFIRRPDRSR